MMDAEGPHPPCSRREDNGDECTMLNFYISVFDLLYDLFCFHPHCYLAQTALMMQQVTLSTQMLKQNGVSSVLEESGNLCIGALLRSRECS